MAFNKNSKRAAEHEHRTSLCGINWVNLVRWLPATQQIIPKHRPQGGSTKENRLRWAVLKPVYINNQEAYHLHINYISLQQQTSSIVMRFLTSTPSQQLVFTAINHLTFFYSRSHEPLISDNMDITPWLAHKTCQYLNRFLSTHLLNFKSYKAMTWNLNKQGPFEISWKGKLLGSETDPLRPGKGVSQGSALAPNLFCITSLIKIW